MSRFPHTPRNPHVLVSCPLCKRLHPPRNPGASSSICSACASLLRLRVAPEAITALRDAPERVRLHPALARRLTARRRARPRLGPPSSG